MEDHLKVVVCHSEDVDTEDAVEDLMKQADSKLNQEKPDACILFAAIDYDHETMLKKINKRWEGLKLVGGTTDGEMSSTLGFAEDSVVMVLFKSDRVTFSTGLGDKLSEGMPEALKKATEESIREAVDPKLCITIPGNAFINIDQIVRSLKSNLGEGIPIFGAVPGDQWRFKTQYQFHGDNVYTDSVPLLILSGQVAFSYGVDSGWGPIGEIGTVTRSEGNIIHTIDDKPAIDFYKRGLGELITPSGEFPLVVLDAANDIMHQRAAARLLEDGSGGIIFLGEVPQGARVQIASAQREDILRGAKISMTEAKQKFPAESKIKGCLFFSCAARKALLGTQTGDEIKIARELFGDTIPMGGFYGYGEISPLKKEANNSMCHNQTFVTLLLGN